MDRDALERTRKLCLALPEATEKPGPMTGFLVRNKTFAWFTDNHHGDGRVAIWCKAAPDDQDLLATTDPIRFFIPPYVGRFGWIGARLDRDPDWGELAALIRDSYRLVAPKRLVTLLADN